MSYIIVYYRINAVLSSILCPITVFLILRKSTKEMGKYKWILLNIQVSAYVESLFWTTFFAPLLEPYPLFHVYCTGVLWSLFQMPTGVEWGISTFFHSLIFAAVSAAFTFRHFLLLPLSNSKVSRLIKKKGAFTLYSYIYIAALPFTYGSAKAFLSIDDTSKLLLEADPNYTIPDGSMTVGGIYATVWGIALLAAAIGQSSVTALIISHISSIMKTSSISAKSIRMHKEAIRSTLIQAAMMWGGCIIPMSMLAYGLYVGIQDISRWLIELGASFGVIWFSSKSINCSIAVCFTTSPYRRYLLRKIGLGNATQTSVVSFSQTN